MVSRYNILLLFVLDFGSTEKVQMDPQGRRTFSLLHFSRTFGKSHHAEQLSCNTNRTRSCSHEINQKLSKSVWLRICTLDENPIAQTSSLCSSKNFNRHWFHRQRNCRNFAISSAPSVFRSFDKFISHLSRLCAHYEREAGPSSL